jgi:hypothetical protein
MIWLDQKLICILKKTKKCNYETQTLIYNLDK